MEKAKTNSNGSLIAIIAMFFLFAMISFVTNLAAPLGTIWKNNYEWSGMLGNMMNFLAYLFMGIPAGNLLMKIGYKKTALYAMIVGLVGLVFQWLSGIVGTETGVFDVAGQTVTLNFLIYLLGAFICGFCVCMLNTVVNPHAQPPRRRRQQGQPARAERRHIQLARRHTDPALRRHAHR